MATTYQTKQETKLDQHRKTYSNLLAIFGYGLICYEYSTLNPVLLLSRNAKPKPCPVLILILIILAYIAIRDVLNDRPRNENITYTLMPLAIASFVTTIVGPYNGPSGIDGIAEAIVHTFLETTTGTLLAYIINLILTIKQNKKSQKTTPTTEKTRVIIATLIAITLIFAIKTVHNMFIPKPEKPNEAYEYTSRGYSESHRYLEEYYEYLDKLW